MKGKNIGKSVRERYGGIARQGGSCCGTKNTCCSEDPARNISKKIGYSEQDLGTVPEGANLGLGCGNPVAIASLRKGETVLDLGSGAGIDCFIAASMVGPEGKVIGVDMTPEMVDRARENADKGDYENVEFRLGEIENLPVADGSVDVVISNCVINLSRDKKRVFREAARVLRTGGRLSVSDIVLLKDLPPSVRESAEAYVGCVSGALLRDEYLSAIGEAGFKDVTVMAETAFPMDLTETDPFVAEIARGSGIAEEEIAAAARSIRSIKVTATKR